MNRLLPIAAMDCLIAYCAPCPIDIISTTAPTPITMPSMVSSVRRRLAPIARQASPSMANIMPPPHPRAMQILILRFRRLAALPAPALRVPCSCRHLNMRCGMIVDDTPVEKMHLALCMARDILFVRDQHDGDAFAIQLFEQCHDFFASVAV